METKEYIVVLKDGIDYNQFWTEIESATVGLPHVPDRPVGIVNNRTAFKRICEYALTDAEADLLKNDSRVESVEIPVRNLPNVGIVNNIVQNAAAVNMNFNKQAGNISAGAPADYTFPAKASINWGLIRHSNQTNPYGVNSAGYTGLTTAQNYNYVPTGTNVDVIINDTGIQVNHPEFTNNLGVSRVNNVNWNSIAAALGIPRNPIPGSNRTWNNLSYSDTGNDINGHGTNVAGIAVGKTYGWAKNANIISLYSDSITGQSSAEPLDTFEMMLYWHQHKGNNNPTIVNMSWSLSILRKSFLDYYPTITGGSYRGTAIASGQSDSYYQQRGLIPLIGNGFPVQDLTNPLFFPYTSAAYNAALGQLIDDGIIVCQSAGNTSFKIDTPTVDGGTGDYDNYITLSGVLGNLYYQRGASPKDPRSITVGALDTLTSSTGQDQKAQFSCAGPGVDIYAAGTYIMSAGPSQPNLGALYFLNQPGQNFKELVSSGTSQATPQITGMASLYLQAHPVANIYSANNCSTVKSWVTNSATTTTFYQTGNATSYTNYLSLLGGQPRVAFQSMQGLGFANNGGWRPIANVYVKGSSSWEPVKAGYIKTISGWTQVF